MSVRLLETPRLILRPLEAEDFAAYRDFYSDAEASSFYGGPLSPALAWRRLAYDLGHWSLRGFGMRAVVERETARTVGGCGIVWAEGWPRHELTWWILPSARRKGYALEASRAVIDWAYEQLDWDCVETHMLDSNVPARLLVEKLNGKVIARELFPDGVARNIYSLPGSRSKAG